MPANLDLARSVYELLVHRHPDGLTRLNLAAKLKCDDRTARDAVNTCRYLAAATPRKSDGRVFIVGFDPLYKVYCAAQNPEQARRVIEYQQARITDITRALDAQREAFEQTFGVKYRATEEVELFI